MIKLNKPYEFDWDKGNRDKNLIKHGVSQEEAEQVFFDQKNLLFKDPDHSKSEDRHILIGKTSLNRLLFVVFTIRNKKIRIISARDLKKRKELNLYEKTASNTKI